MAWSGLAFQFTRKKVNGGVDDDDDDEREEPDCDSLFLCVLHRHIYATWVCNNSIRSSTNSK